MRFDFNAKGTAYFVDPKYHMMLHINYNWDPTGGEGRGDAIGRTFEAYFAYGDRRFVEAVKSCWVKVKTKNGYYYQGYRYPTHKDNDMSRDHVFNTVLMLIASGHFESEIRQFVTHIPWRISDRYRQTLDFWLWTRAVSGIWWAKILSPIVEIPIMTITLLWQKFIYAITPFHQEMSQDEFAKIKDFKKTKRMKLLGSTLYPSYTMTQYAWRLYYAKNSLSKKILSWLLLKMANKHNYIVRMLLGDKVRPTAEQIFFYKTMMGGRWDGILNPEINDRDLHIITKSRYPKDYDDMVKCNLLDVDLLRAVYKKTK